MGTVLTGANIGVLVVGVLGCVFGAREYGSRMIASTVAAVPRRWQVVVSKALVLTGVLVVTTVVGVVGAFTIGMAVLRSGGSPTAALGDPGVLREVLGMAGYLTAVGLLGMGLGVLLRSVAGSIGVLVAGLLVLPRLAGALLPAGWDPALKYLPRLGSGRVHHRGTRGDRRAEAPVRAPRCWSCGCSRSWAARCGRSAGATSDQPVHPATARHDDATGQPRSTARRTTAPLDDARSARHRQTADKRRRSTARDR